MTEELNISDELTQEKNELEHVEEAKVEETEEVAEHVEETTAVEEAKEEIPQKQFVKKQSMEIPNREDFNWDELGKHKSGYTLSEQKQLEDIYNNTFNAIVEQEVVMGTIVAKNTREVVVNIGFKSDGVLPANELRYLSDLKIGDKVEVYVESQEDASGQLLLSHKKARLLKSWERVNQAHDTGEIITGHVRSKTKGGLIVDVFGIEAFLPGSQIDVKPIRDYDIFVDKTMEFKVVKINHEFKNVVISHKALIESELEAQRLEIMSELEKGQVLEGVVKNITNYGAFIDLGGVDGLVHITDLSWGRINDPKEVLELDQKINVVILDFDESKKRIALGIKQLTPHPWDALDANLQVGDKVKGKVVVIADYGAFIEILPGVEGLVHVSEMSWSQHLRTAQDFMKVGDEVESVILTLDRDDRKMSLGIKQLIPDPWITIADRYPIGSRHSAIVRNFTIFGIFVELEEGVDGLIHISDLSWSKKIKHPAEFTKIGEKIDVVVLEMDAENRRLSLGHKQLEENPWDIFETIYTIGSIHQGTITAQNDKGSIINLQGVEGFAYYRGLQREDNSTIKVGETEDFKVLEFSKENKKIVLSHTKIWQDIKEAERENSEEQSEKKKKSAKQVVDNSEKSTLGDLDALVSLKADLELAEGKSPKKAVEKSEKVEEKPKKTRAKKAEIAVEDEVNTEEETPKAVDTAIIETEANTEEETPKTVDVAVENEVNVEEASKAEIMVEESEAIAEEKPKKTRTKKAEKEVDPNSEVEKPKKTRAKKAEKTEKEVETTPQEEKPLEE